MAVAAGSIAFVGYNFDNYNANANNTQGFAFVTTAEIGVGEKIRFVDGGWNGTALSVSSQVVWTNGTSTLPAGTVVQVTLDTYAGLTGAGFTTATTNLGTVTNPTNASGAAARWNVGLTESLYAVTTTSGTAPGDFVAGVVWGDLDTAGITAGATLFDPGTAGTLIDVGMINAATANTAYGSVSAAKAAYTNAANWVQDRDAGTMDDPDDGPNDVDWPPLTNENSTLQNHTTLTIATPTVAFGDANGLVNSAESSATPVTVGGLGAGATAVVTFTSSGGGTATASFSGNGTVNANLAGLTDGTVTVSRIVVSNGGTDTTIDNPTAASLTLDKTPPASGGTVILSDPGGDGIQYGEANAYAFDVAGVSGGTATVTFTSSGGGTPVVVAGLGNGSHTVNLGALPSGTVAATISNSDAAGNATAGTGASIEAVICFYPGTRVATPDGERAVETLRAGELVLTADGAAAPIRWVGRQTVSTVFADPLRVLPVRIAAGALGEDLPKRDLLVSPDHALLVDGALVQAGALVNGTTIRRERDVPEVFTYWHVELADHALVLAEGVPAETFIDNVARLAFDNWAEHEAAADPAPIAEMALPRAKSARQVPAATRQRLAARAALLLGAAATAAA